MVDEGIAGGREVFIGGVPQNMTSDILQSALETNFGPVNSVNWRDGRSFQFVTFSRQDSAATALAGQSFQLPDGQSVQIRPAKRQKNTTNAMPFNQMVPPIQLLPMHMPAFPMSGPVINAGPGPGGTGAPPFSESDKLTNYKLIVTGLPPNVMQHDVVSYFAQFGQVTEVSFLSPSSCHVRLQNAQRRGDVVITKHNQHMVAGKPVEVADTTDSVVFVNRIPTETTTEQLREYMSAKYGTVVAIDRPKDTGYVFCVFEDEAVAASVIAAGSDEERGFAFGHAKPRANRGQQQVQRQQQHLLKRTFDQMMMAQPVIPQQPLPIPSVGPAQQYPLPMPAAAGAGGGSSFTLHVSNIPLDATAPAIAGYFSHFGSCTPADVKMMIKMGKPQNYCFVTISNALVPLQTLIETSHVIGASPIKVGIAKEQAQPSIPNGMAGGLGGGMGMAPHPGPAMMMMAAQPPPSQQPMLQPPPVTLHAGVGDGAGLGAVGSTYTLHVSNLPPDASQQSLAAYFSQFGACASSDVRMMHKDGKLQNYCFVTVNNASMPMQLLLDGRHLFGPVQLQVGVAKHQVSALAPPPLSAPLW